MISGGFMRVWLKNISLLFIFLNLCLLNANEDIPITETAAQHDQMQPSSAEHKIPRIVFIDKTADGVNFKLNSGLIATFPHTDLFSEEQWKVGDAAAIDYSTGSGYSLVNLNAIGYVPVTLSYAPDSEFARITKITKTGYISLDDGTVWFVGPWSRLWGLDWAVGDRVVSEPGYFPLQSATHWLINVDRHLVGRNYKIYGNARAQRMEPSYSEEELGWVNDIEYRNEGIIFPIVEKVDEQNKTLTFSNGLVVFAGDEIDSWKPKDPVGVSVTGYPWQEQKVFITDKHSNKKLSVKLQDVIDAPHISFLRDNKMQLSSGHALLLYPSVDTRATLSNWKEGDRIAFEQVGPLTVFVLNLDNQEKVVGTIAY